MKLNQLSDNQGARKNRNRVGRGMASGNGKTAGRGHKGLGARSGGKVMPGFEGGQFPLYRRIPMRGFNNYNFAKTYTTINVGDLEELVKLGRIDAKKPVTIASLQAAGYTKKANDGLKVLGGGDVKTAFTIEAAAASGSALAKIEKAGGKITLPVAVEKVAKLPKKEGKATTTTRLEKKNAAKKAAN